MFISDLFEASKRQTLVIIPGGFHPFHPGHLSLYRSAEAAFPGATIVYVATDDQKDRPFPFAAKQKLAQIAGVNPKNFALVKSPFVAKEVTQNFDPNTTVLIFARSEKDRNEHPKPGGVKKDGSPSYLQPYTKGELAPMAQHGYMAYLPTVEFDAGPSGVTSATQIREMWPNANPAQKQEIVKDLYPKNPQAAQQILDKYLGQGVAESDSPRTMGLDASLDQHFQDKKHLLNPGVARPGQLVTIIKAPRMLDLLPGETFEVRTSDADGVTLKHGLGTRYDNVKFPHGTYKIAKAQGVAEGIPSFTPGSEMHKQHQARMAEYGRELNALGKKIKFHQKGQAAAQYKGSMNKMHAEKIRELLSQVDELQQRYGLNEDEPGMDPNVIQLKKRAKVAHPFAQSDEEALALYVNDREIRDVDNLEREQNRELRMINRIEQAEDHLSNQIQRIDQELAQLTAMKSK